MTKIKVLHLITHLGFGGASDNTLETVERLPRARYTVHLGAGADYTDWVERGKQGSDAFFLFPDMVRSPKLIADVRLLNQLTRFMREQKYDIVHTHNAKAGVIGRMAARRAGVPIILHTMHLLSWQDTHGGSESLLGKWIDPIQSQLFLRLERYAASISDRVVTVCESNMEEALRYKLAPREKLATIYSGIDLNRFAVKVDRAAKCESIGLDWRRPIVGMIGRLSPQKAPLDFIAAAKLVLQQKPDTQFIMVGNGPLLSEVVAAVGDESRIHILGYRDDVPEIYGILDIFALSSLWEGLGRALTEAMSVGIPVAATAVNGVPELVIHNKTGLLSPPSEPSKLGENILLLLENPAVAKAMAQQARANVLPNFGSQLMVDKIDALYEELLTARQKGHPSVVAREVEKVNA